MIIEKMQEQHLLQVAEIENLCFSHPWSQQSLKAELEKQGTYFFVAVCDGKTVGYMGIETVLDEGYVTNVAVVPQYRRKGIGKALVEYGLKLCRENDISFLTLEVRQSNEAAKNLYSQLGFVQAGERKNYYSEPKEDALLMTKYFK